MSVIHPPLDDVGVPKAYQALIWRRQLNERAALFRPCHQVIII